MRLRRRAANYACFNPRVELTKTRTTSPVDELLPFPFPERIGLAVAASHRVSTASRGSTRRHAHSAIKRAPSAFG